MATTAGVREGAGADGFGVEGEGLGLEFVGGVGFTIGAAIAIGATNASAAIDAVTDVVARAPALFLLEVIPLFLLSARLSR